MAKKFQPNDFLMVVNGTRPAWMSLTDKLATISGMSGLEACDYVGRALALAGWSRSSGLRFYEYPEVAAMIFNRVSDVLEITHDPDRLLEELETRR